MTTLFKKYKSIILYILFGALTTAVNFATYYIAFNLLWIPNVPSTVIAWVLSVAFAYITNKIWVFSSRSFDRKTIAKEIPSFLSARITTGVLDVGIMYVTVDLLHWNGAVWKLISNVIVIVLNYIASKLIFRKTVSK